MDKIRDFFNSNGFEVNSEYFFFFADWMKKRMDIFWHKDPKDSVLTAHKFTNVYRVLDRVSQYLVKKISNRIDLTEKDKFWQTYVFRLLNSIETWELIQEKFGDLKYPKNFEGLKELADYCIKLQNDDVAIFGPAYKRCTATMERFEVHYKSKRESVKVSEKQVSRYLYSMWHAVENKNFFDILVSKPVDEVVNAFLDVYLFSEFLTYQHMTDFGYGNILKAHENEYVLIGPGADAGIKKIFSLKGLDKKKELVSLVRENLNDIFDIYGIEFSGIEGRMPTNIDVQNAFCETNKFLRGKGIKSGKEGDSRIKFKYKRNKNIIKKFEFPTHWNVEPIIFENIKTKKRIF